MTTSDLKTIFRYFKGEKENPFIGKDSDAAMWWEGEKQLYYTVLFNKNEWQRITNLLRDAIRDQKVKKPLNDTTIPLERRVVIFYLDLWHGKWFPYDDLDKIFDYAKV